MNQLFISFFVTSAMSMLVFIVLLLITITLQFRKKHSWFHWSVRSFVSGFRLQLLNTEMLAQEAIFRMISREIHDNIGLTLTAVKHFLYRLKPRQDPDEARYLKGSMGMLSRAMDQLRHISHSMNGDVLEDQGLVNALQQEVDRINQLDHLQIALRVEGEEKNFETSKEIAVLRMIQESINNVIKHAKARMVDIQLRFSGNRLDLQVCDDGIGIGAALEKKVMGSGLINLHKRAELLQGCCKIISNQPKGTTIAISIPIN
ncbi:sensor histidine kinase [Pseudobacter ginsenosidimutans]|jgi:signal transduction histidine kinase|uniref:histidine kinase n=1 Tax=Pseudobacter ginsenosidimutans TaxID=661488 RepID=A0A4Q7MLM4_9BACT|nr:ATP-binding protein [Pseudobacter ginsenosidimutans]QEC40492.1 hypothetical protein FSB84_01805 [Pseudobacter ginsenosidimutans]RZS68897.1 signal transduction histidine kinase [Pseudobacter ginsenosidimutans]